MSQLPGDTSLPLFVYGALKPGEISWPLLEPFAESQTNAQVDNYTMHLVDGMPMAKFKERSQLSGFLVTLTNNNEAYKAIGAFENVGTYYVWQEVVIHGSRANILRAKSKDKNVGIEIFSWSAAEDPYFSQLIPYSFEKLPQLSLVLKGVGDTSKSPYIHAFLELQSVYMLLWAMLERLYLFRVGYTKKQLGEKIEHLEGLEEWTQAFNQAGVTTKRTILPHSESWKSPPRGEDLTSFDDWQTARNNIVHRGKGNQNEVHLLLRMTIDMHNTLAILLQDISPSVCNLWLELTKTKKDEHTGRLYVIQQ
jgi:gamma-glutamylcyclotransferase (GGCT)/AIG2-like uncharacterized protein YtfP